MECGKIAKLIWVTENIGCRFDVSCLSPWRFRLPHAHGSLMWPFSDLVCILYNVEIIPDASSYTSDIPR